MDFSPVGNETLILKVVIYKPHKQLQHEIKHFNSVSVANTARMGNCSYVQNGGLFDMTM